MIVSATFYLPILLTDAEREKIESEIPKSSSLEIFLDTQFSPDVGGEIHENQEKRYVISSENASVNDCTLVLKVLNGGFLSETTRKTELHRISLREIRERFVKIKELLST